MREVSWATRSVTRIVPSRVVPPAPYVIETKVGRSCSISRMDRQSTSSASGVFGGKNSNEKDRSPVASSSRIVGVLPGSFEGRPFAIVQGYRAWARAGRRTTLRDVYADADIPTDIQRTLTSFLDVQHERLAAIGPELTEVVQAARDATSGGKRLRPAFCYWGFRASGGDPEQP